MFHVKKTTNENIALVEHIGDLSGGQALEFQDYLNKCLDNNSCFQLISFKRTAHIDGLGYKILSDFMGRGGQVRLFNVEPEIKWILQNQTKKNVVKFYDESNADVALSLFEKDLKDKNETISELKSRLHIRIATNIPTEFKVHPGNNGTVHGYAKIINLSEGGLLLNQINRLKDSKGQIIKPYELKGKKFSDIKLELEKANNYFLTNGHCVWVTNGSHRLFAGIQFNKLSGKNQVRISDFVLRNFNDKVT